jgi:hypothetical protein
MSIRTHFAAVAVLAVAVGFLGCSDNGTAPEQTTDEGPAIETWAGDGTAGYDGDGNTPLLSSFYWPIDVEFTPTQGTFFVDFNNHRIRKLMQDGTLATVMGTNIIGDGAVDQSDLTPPGAPGTECLLNHPTRMIELTHGSNAGKIVLTCWHNHKLRLWDPATGLITVMFGRGADYAGDGQDAAAFGRVNQPQQTLEGSDGSLYILDQRNQVFRKLDTNGIITTVAGVFTGGSPTDGSYGDYNGDGLAPLATQFNFSSGPNPQPSGAFLLDAEDNFYVADPQNHLIRKIDWAANKVTILAGQPGMAGYSGDGASAKSARLNDPIDLAWGPDGKIYIADQKNHAVRVLDLTSGKIGTVAGTGTAGFSGDGGPAKKARLALPRGVAFDANGDLFITETDNHRVRRVLMH